MPRVPEASSPSASHDVDHQAVGNDTIGVEQSDKPVVSGRGTIVQGDVSQRIAATTIDGEKDLGINKEVGTFLANFQWRISRRSRLNLNYYNIKRNSNHILQKDIIFGDNTYYAISSVYTFFNTAIYQFSYGYAILSKPKYEAGLLIGSHIVGANSGISLNGISNGLSVSNNFGFTAPLPDLGIWGGFATSDRFAINAEVSYFSLTMNHNTGRLLAFNLTFTYKLIKQLDLSLGYSGLDFKVITTKDNLTGNFKWGYNGPLLAVSFSFGKKSWGHPLNKPNS